MVFGRYTATIVPLNDLGIRLVAVGAIAVLSAINYVGVRPGSSVQTGADDRQDRRDRRAAGPAVRRWARRTCPRRSARSQPRGFLRALVAGLFAFGGWHMVTYAAEETHNPERTIPRALMLGTAVVVVIYLALNSAYLLVLPFDAVLKSTHIAFDATLATAGPRGGVGDLDPGHRVVVRRDQRHRPRRTARLLRDGRGRPAVQVDGRGPSACTRRRISRSSCRAIWSSVLVLTGTYGVIVSRVVYTEWIFFGALALGTIALRRVARLRAGVPRVGLSRSCRSSSRSSASRLS